MQQELLLKYISGEVTQTEKEEVATWIDESPANLRKFMSLRKSYDALIWQHSDELCSKASGKRLWQISLQKIWQMAAVFIISFGLSYMVLQVLPAEEPEIQTVYVPAGQRTQVTLADGSMVWVNGKSTLIFPGKFSTETRNVQLDGEAYFEIKKDPKKQFIVSTAHQSCIKVLGTKFNVRAYKDADEITTTLVEGKVNFEFCDDNQQFQLISMVPGQKLIYHTQNKKVELHTTTGDKELSWKDGKIIFYQNTLREALNILKIRYNVQFVIRDHVSREDSFTGTFANKNLEQILNYFEASSSMKWRYIDEGRNNGEGVVIEIY